MNGIVRIGLLSAVTLLGSAGAVTASSVAEASFVAPGFPGCALSIGVSTTSEWVVGCDHNVYEAVNNQWTLKASKASASKIAVSPEGTPWMIDTNGIVNQWNGTRFAAISAPGCASQIGVGSSNQAWIIGCTSLGSGGNGIYYLNPVGTTFPALSPGWTQVAGAATQISVEPNGTPWVINGQGTVYKWSGTAFAALPVSGCATSIAVGANDDAWIVGCTSAGPGGNGIFEWSGTTWATRSGAESRIAVAGGAPWALDVNGQISKWTPETREGWTWRASPLRFPRYAALS